VLIIDPWWNPFVEQQAVDRTHRIGQTKNVTVYKFITKDTIEEKMLNLQKTKLKLSESFIDSGTTSEMIANEIEELLN
jgi:SNF2 family DNA or RNA helicase